MTSPGGDISLSDVDFAYGHLQVLFGVSMSVQAGEMVALLGTNGAGKSSLLRVLTGLARPKNGSVVLDGEDITGRSPADILGRGVVMVAGGRGVFGDLTVADNLEVAGYTLKAARDRRERVEGALDMFPVLRQHWRQRASCLSGGEQQQLALAKALLLRPRVLCIDELSLGLAPAVVGALLDIVRLVNADGTSLVLVEQSLNVAAELTQRAVFLEKGSVRFQGRTRELLDRADIARAVFLGGQPVAS